MLPIAGKSAGPIGLKFFVDTHGWPHGVIGKKNLIFFKQNVFHGQRRVPQLVSYKINN